MFSLKMLILFALTLFGCAYGDVVSSGACPECISVKPNFDVGRYLGVWFESFSYPTFFEPNGKCTTAYYTAQDDGNVGVRNTLIDKTTGEVSEIQGYATIFDNAKLKVVFPVTNTVNATSNYWVLDTDYDTYSVVYSCQPLSSLLHSTTAWILTRDRIPTAATIATAENVLVLNNISLDPLEKTEQTGCPAADCLP